MNFGKAKRVIMELIIIGLLGVEAGIILRLMKVGLYCSSIEKRMWLL